MYSRNHAQLTIGHIRQLVDKILLRLPYPTPTFIAADNKSNRLCDVKRKVHRPLPGAIRETTSTRTCPTPFLLYDQWQLLYIETSSDRYHR